MEKLFVDYLVRYVPYIITSLEALVHCVKFLLGVFLGWIMESL